MFDCGEVISPVGQSDEELDVELELDESEELLDEPVEPLLPDSELPELEPDPLEPDPLEPDELVVELEDPRLSVL